MTREEESRITESARKYIENMQRVEGGRPSVSALEVERAVKETAAAFNRFSRKATEPKEPQRF